MLRAPSLAAVVVVALILAVETPVRAWDAIPPAAPAAPDAVGLRVETLLDAAVEGLPTERARVAVDRWRLRSSPRPLRMPALGGPVILVLETGTLTATVAGSEHRLAAGDEIFLSGDEAVAFEAVGPDEAVAFAVYVVPTFTGAGMEWDSDPMAHAFDYPIDASADDLPGGRVACSWSG